MLVDIQQQHSFKHSCTLHLQYLAFLHLSFQIFHRSFIPDDICPSYDSQYPHIVPCSTRGSQRGCALRTLTSRAAPYSTSQIHLLFEEQLSVRAAGVIFIWSQQYTVHVWYTLPCCLKIGYDLFLQEPFKEIKKETQSSCHSTLHNLKSWKSIAKHPKNQPINRNWRESNKMYDPDILCGNNFY